MKKVLYSASIGFGVLLVILALARLVPANVVTIGGAFMALVGVVLLAVPSLGNATHDDALKLYGHALAIVGAIWVLGGVLAGVVTG